MTFCELVKKRYAVKNKIFGKKNKSIKPVGKKKKLHRKRKELRTVIFNVNSLV